MLRVPLGSSQGGTTSVTIKGGDSWTRLTSTSFVIRSSSKTVNLHLAISNSFPFLSASISAVLNLVFIVTLASVPSVPPALTERAFSGVMLVDPFLEPPSRD
jgi:hypothetical protein